MNRKIKMVLDEVAEGRHRNFPSHWLEKPTLWDCPNCKRKAGEVCVVLKSRPFGKPCWSRVKLAQKNLEMYLRDKEK